MRTRLSFEPVMTHLPSGEMATERTSPYEDSHQRRVIRAKNKLVKFQLFIHLCQHPIFLFQLMNPAELTL
jgi:hypothetical protein